MPKNHCLLPLGKRIQRAGAIAGLVWLASCAHHPSSPEVVINRPIDSKKTALVDESGALIEGDAVKRNVVDLQWPIESARLSRGYTPGKKKHRHLGLDLAAPKNTPILAAHDGVIVYAGRSIHGYGRMVMLEAKPASIATLYAHMSKFNVKLGQKVRQGDIIGFVGRSGHATGYHLHFELRTKDGALDPLEFLPEVVGKHRLANMSDESD